MWEDSVTGCYEPHDGGGNPGSYAAQARTANHAIVDDPTRTDGTLTHKALETMSGQVRQFIKYITNKNLPDVYRYSGIISYVQLWARAHAQCCYLDLIVDLPMLKQMVHVAANNIGGT